MRLTILFLALGVWASCSAADFQPRDLLVNGRFEKGEPRPHGWTVNGATLEKEDATRFLRLRPAKPGAAATAIQNVKLEPDWGFLRVSCRVRYRNIVRGAEGWHDGRIAMTFKDAKGQRVGPWPNVLHWAGTSEGWKDESREFLIPEGAVSVDISLALFYVQSGEIDFAEVGVAAVRLRPRLEDAARPADADGPMWVSDTATRGRVCLNGYWRFRPIGLGDDVLEIKPEMLKTPPPIPKSPGWGWLKAPSCWPWTPQAGHNAVAPDIWAVTLEGKQPEAAWYQREIAVPQEWRGRRILLSFDMPQTQAAVLVDGKFLNAVRWPEGRLDLTGVVKPGQKAVVTVFVTALPFEAEKMVAMREDMIFKAKSEVRFKGLCGDVYLESEPTGPRIAGAQFRPSVHKKQLGLQMRMEGLLDGDAYTLSVEPAIAGAAETTWTSPPFKAEDAAEGLALAMPWLARKLWDLDQPNLYDVRLQLRRAGDAAVLDERVERMGFREVRLEGRNIILNGTPIHWRALDFTNHVGNAGAASYERCRETFRRMRSLGFNFAILGNYGFDPGETMTFEDLLRAADDAGFMISFSTPHPLRSLAGYDTKRGLSDEWKTLAEYCVRKAQNHPSVLAYAMSHNVLGYGADQNPAKMDGRYQPVPPDEKQRKSFVEKREVAAGAEAYVRALDPTRPVYHHQSGHMGDWHTVNIYLCWAPMQERMEWLSHWAKAGVKPLFFVEWGLPHIASWGGHRIGPFIWRNKVNSEPLAVEFGAAVTGDAAYRLNEDEERHIDNYERVYARGTPFHISEVLGDYWANAREHNMVEIQSEFTRHVWPAFRTWGISAMLPWDQGNVARRKTDVPPRMDAARKADEARAPGIHPDFVPNRGDYFQFGDLAALELSSLGETFRRVNADFVAYIAGREKRFTEQGHIFHPRETVEKQVVIINDRRAPCKGRFEWIATAAGKEAGRGGGTFDVKAGEVRRWPIRFRLPDETIGAGRVRLAVVPDVGATVEESFGFHVVARPAAATGEAAVLDPVGKTTADLKRLKIRVKEVRTVPPDAGCLVIGRQALSGPGEFPDVAPVLSRGGTVLVMEQDEAVLSGRLGFRTNVPSLRRAFTRVPDHPVVEGLNNELLRDWRGEAALIPTQYDLPAWEAGYPMVDWLGFQNSRAWKWGNQGQVASVVIEKPQKGDFLPILDGGFDLQYAPLLEMRLGAGRILFCQMDVSGRTEPDPAADRLLVNLVRYAQSAAPPAPAVKAWGADETAKKLLKGLGVVTADGATPQPSDILVAGRDQKDAGLVRRHAEAGGTAFVFDGSAEVLKAALPQGAAVTEQKLTHTPPPLASSAAWRGVGPSDLHWRGRTTVNTVRGVGESVSTGALAAATVGKGKVVACAVTPDRFDYGAPNRIYLKLTHKRAAFLASRLLANQNAAFETPLLRYWTTQAPADLPIGGQWMGTPDPAETLKADALSAPEFDTADWKPIAVPGEWEKQRPEWAAYNGVFWYRLVFDAPQTQASEETLLDLGPIDDEDWTYLNGRLVGHIGQDTHPNDYWSAERSYTLAPGALKAGRNVLVVKVRDLRQSGGIMKGPVRIRVPSRWLRSYYLDEPAPLDDPYRYNRW